MFQLNLSYTIASSSVKKTVFLIVASINFCIHVICLSKDGTHGILFSSVHRIASKLPPLVLGWCGQFGSLHSR